jgi:transposase
MWCIPKLDDQFIQRMEDVLWLYSQPYDSKAPVLCLDEKSVQLLEHSRTPIAVSPGQPAKIDHEYVRNGTANIFACFEPKRGNPVLQVTDRRTAQDFARFLASLVTRYPKTRTIHLVMDNLNTHFEKSVIETFGPRRGSAIWRKFTVHYTPKHASWLNQAELLLSAVSRATLKKTRHPTKQSLRKSLSAWRQQNKTFQTKWKFSIKDAQQKFKYKN